MKHRHKYEAVTYHGLTAEAKALGIRASEIRKCTTCKKEMTFIQTKDGWHQLFEDRESDEQDILLA